MVDSVSDGPSMKGAVDVSPGPKAAEIKTISEVSDESSVRVYGTTVTSDLSSSRQDGDRAKLLDPKLVPVGYPVRVASEEVTEDDHEPA